MGFIGSSSAREFDSQTDLPDPHPINEIDYELEIELAADESESESSFEDDALDQPDAIPTNNTSDLFEFFFRDQARLAFLNRGNHANNYNDVSQSNDRLSVVLLRDHLVQLHSRLHQRCRHHLRRQLHRRPYHLHACCLQSLQGQAIRSGDGVLCTGIRIHHHLVGACRRLRHGSRG